MHILMEININFSALCRLLPSIGNGDITYSNSDRRAGTEANFTCNIGFLIVPENGSTRTCVTVTGGTWSGTSPTCSEFTAMLSYCMCFVHTLFME